MIYEEINSKKAHVHEMHINTHEIVVKNSGKLPAKNVRLGHKVLPNYTINPISKYEISDISGISGGGKEISFHMLIPNEQITISYLYFPPITYEKINMSIKSDEGFAKLIHVIPTPILDTWQKISVYILLFVGGSTLMYWIIRGLIFISDHLDAF